MNYLFATVFLALAVLIGMQPGMAPAGVGIGALTLIMLWRSTREPKRRSRAAPRPRRRISDILPSRADREGGND